MKKLKLLLNVGGIFSPIFLFSQIGINTVSPNSSAILDITSNKGGVLIPRMTEAQRNAILNPAEGLEIYAIDKAAKYYFDGVSWTRTNKTVFTTSTQIYTFSDAVTPSGAGSDLVSNFFTGLQRTYNSYDANFANVFDTNTVEITQSGRYFIEIVGYMKRTGANMGAQISGIVQILKNGAPIGESYSAIGAFPATPVANANSMTYTLVEDLVVGDKITLNYWKTDTASNDSNALGFYENILIIRK
ncbi:MULTISPECIES: hypothetical protein [unclassified Chryseobacterium]|uniref:hypothetical protein n=1 Tax=unclassified Chryseobacterium TaxID=2593645 RepID=UPI0030101060